MSGAPGTTQGRWRVAPWTSEEAAVMSGGTLVSGGYALKPDAYQMAASQRMYDALAALIGQVEQGHMAFMREPSDSTKAALIEAQTALALARGESVA